MFKRFCFFIAGVSVMIQIFVVFAKTNFFFDLFTNYAVYYAFFWTIFALICLSKKHFYSALVLLTIASINVAEIAPYLTPKIPPANQVTISKNTLTILSNNFFYKNQNVGDFSALLNEENPTIFVIHEAGEIWKNRLSELSQTYPYLYLTKETGIHGILIGSRIPGTFKEIPLGNKFGLEFLTQNESHQSGQYPQSLRILAVHPEAPLSPTLAKSRNSQFKDIAAYITEDPNRTIVIGDFNCTPWSPYFKELLASGLTNASLNFGLIPTWHSGFSPFKLQIDHALITKDITVDFFNLARAVTGADHLPIELGIN